MQLRHLTPEASGHAQIDIFQYLPWFLDLTFIWYKSTLIFLNFPNRYQGRSCTGDIIWNMELIDDASLVMWLSLEALSSL